MVDPWEELFGRYLAPERREAELTPVSVRRGR